MDVKKHTQDDITVVTLGGRFDAYEVPEVMKALEAASAKKPAQIVVNLSGVNFIDSSALALLVKFMKNCREGGGDLKLSNLMQPVRIIFELTRLDKAIEIFADEAAALDAFA